MAKTSTSSGAKHWLGVIIAIILFIFSAVIAFPQQTWNKVGFLPELNIAEFHLGLDLQGGAHLVYEADMSEISESGRQDALSGVRDVIERRVNAFGVSEPLIQTTSSNGVYRVIVELAGVLDVSEAISLIGETPILEFKKPSELTEEDLTDEQRVELDVINAEEFAVAEEILILAQGDNEFSDLVNEYTLADFDKERNGNIGFVTRENTFVYNDVLDFIDSNGVESGAVLNSVFETDNGYEIVELVEKNNTQLMDLSHILSCFDEKENCETDVAREQALESTELLKADLTVENFGDLAALYSDDPTNFETGGDLGQLTARQLVDPFGEVALALQVGAITSEPIETEFGYHFIYKKATESISEYDLNRIVLARTTADAFIVENRWENTDLSGKQLESAQVVFDQYSNAPIVQLAFDADGGKLVADLTEAYVGEQIAIFLDGEIISAPVVQQRISGGEAVITGNFSLDEARLLAQRLNAGALPVPIELLSQQTIGPTLGAISLEKSLNAALIGLLLVAVFMILYYRLPGLLAVIALVIYVSLNLMVYKALDVTITLSGIAGFILSVGMAVDANVLIFERLKEELKSGRDLISSVEIGFKRAWSSIRDGNLTTLIAAAVLFWVSTSFVKGFALTLSLGILISMFSAVVITRGFLMAIAHIKGSGKFKWLFGGPTSNRNE